MLELSDKDFKAAMIKKNSSMNNYVYIWNKWTKQKVPEKKTYKNNQMEILKLKDTITKTENSVDRLNRGMKRAEWNGTIFFQMKTKNCQLRILYQQKYPSKVKKK